MKKNTLFNTVALQKLPSNVFDLSHIHNTSCNMGELIPILLMDTIPGDKITLNNRTLLRFMPMLAPVFHRFDVYIHYFAVPRRLLWPNFEKWMTGANDGYVQTPPVTPPAAPRFIVSSSNYTSLLDYLGIPNPSDGFDPDAGAQISTEPLSAYNLIWHEYYRDQNLNVPEWEPLTDGTTSVGDLNALRFIRKRCWEHDYFTSALPWAQKGTVVDIPLGEVVAKETPLTPVDAGWLAYNSGLQQEGPIENDPITGAYAVTSGGNTRVFYDPAGTLEVGATSIIDLRRAFALQAWFERNAVSGSRYTEFLKAHFNVNSSDARLQRPEYITGTKTPVTISEVLNTTGEADGLVQGNMSGHGVAVGTGNGKTYYCEEHCWILGIMSIMPKPMYQQGIARMWTKFDPYDTYFSNFANIGEQEIKQKEIWGLNVDLADGEITFGYQSRYAEYKYMENRVSGEMRTTLNFWHEGRIFTGPPLLNGDFVQCSPSNRIFAVPGQQNIVASIQNIITARRSMPKYGTPMIK